jgi:hypothetical protein
MKAKPGRKRSMTPSETTGLSQRSHDKKTAEGNESGDSRVDKRNKNHGKNTEKSLASSQRGVFATYLLAWKRLLQWRTLFHISLDVLIVLVFVFLLILNGVIWDQLASPLQPALEAVQQLESGQATDESRLALLEDYRPDINGVIMKAIAASAILYLVFIVVSTLLMTLTWASLQRQKFSLRILKKNFILTLVWLALLALIPGLLLFFGEVPALSACVLLFAVTLVFLPFFFAASASGWRSLLSAGQGFWCGATTVIASFSFIAALLSFLILIGVVRLASAGLLQFSDIIPLVFLLLAVCVLFALWLTLLRVRFLNYSVQYSRYLRLILLCAATFVIVFFPITAVAMLLPGVSFALLLIWIFVFIAWTRYCIDTEVRHA